MRPRISILTSFVLVASRIVLADVTTGVPDAAPRGFEDWESPIVLPSPPVQGTDDWASAVDRARAFVAMLTLAEKINITTGIDVLGRCVGNTGTIPRMGWNGLCLQDSPLGVRFTDFVSAFPAGINAAATWDVDLMRARGKAMGREHRGKGVNVALGPMTNMGRVAAGGRNWEGFGADPFLSGAATAATVEGYQSVGVIATVKHYIANEQEHYRGGSDAVQVYSSNIDDRTLHEVYLWPFAEAVKAGVGAVMCSYNKINQTQACQNSKLINGILKEELGFQGFIMSDWAAMINGVQPALAGLDMNMPGFLGYGVGPQNDPNPVTATNSYWGAALIEMVNNGSVTEGRVDDMVTRTLAAWYKMGQDTGYPNVSFSQLTEETYLNGELVNEHINVQEDHYELIREIGAASAILLKNENNALPLSVGNIKRIAIFGSDAGPNPDGPNGCMDRGCDQGTLAMGWGSGTANFPYLIDPLAAITTHINSMDPTVVVEGVLNDYNLAQVKTIGSLADTCLVFANADSGEAYINVGGNVGDRNNLTLWHTGDTLITTAASVCANTIVVLHVVGPVLLEAWIDNPNVTAVLHPGLPGQESGRALVDVLFADGENPTNPSGRLPYTIAKLRTDYPAEVLYSSGNSTPQITYSEGLQIDYRWFDSKGIEPRFEFGFGLSYTTFEYSGLQISVSDNTRRAIPSEALSITPFKTLTATATSNFSASSASASSSPSPSWSFASVQLSPTTSAPPPPLSSPVGDIGGPRELYEDLVTISFTVQNTGSVEGNEVSQVYLAFPSEYGEPPKVLRGFERTYLDVGDEESVEITLRRKDVSVWDVVRQEWVGVTGEVWVMVGSSSRDIRLQGSFEL
ncbi:glycoside hydrolase superfamily [Roridomyces roridus]|uniref:beta-glucosidase n=1 Tax=Roridomyces roridus TaxID=1738132 RepID=A0AAD7FCP9_9AGAR|nr:glycoside hydrolase superfamily [Roridomyces roridus]